MSWTLYPAKQCSVCKRCGNPMLDTGKLVLCPTCAVEALQVLEAHRLGNPSDWPPEFTSAGQPRTRTLQERIDKVTAYATWLRAHGTEWVDSELGGRKRGMVSVDWVISCLAGDFDHLDDWGRPYEIPGCKCAACVRERERCGAIERNDESAG